MKTRELGRRLQNGRIEGSYNVYKKNGDKIRKFFVRDTVDEIQIIKAKLRLLGTIDNDVVDINIDRHTNEIKLVRKGQSRESIGLDKNITVREYVDFYLYEHRRKGIKGKQIEDTTFSVYNDRAKYIKDYFKDKKMKDITYEDVVSFIDTINKKYEDTTTRQVRDMVVSIFKFAKKDGVLEENILQDEQLTLKERKGKKEKKIILEEDLKVFVDYCTEHKYYDLLFILNTGTRASELCGVTWDNIDFEKGTVTIEKEQARVRKKKYKDGKLINNGSEIVFKDLKTKSSYRTIGLPAKFLELLKQHKEEQQELAVKNNKEFKETDNVFTTKTYGKYIGEYADDRFVRTMKATKITNYKELTLHCLRHTYCSLRYYERC